jgi:hypothetical protein
MTSRTITIDDTDYVLPPLTRGQMKMLKKAGFSRLTPEDDPDKIDAVVDMALKLALPETNPDDLPCFVGASLFRELIDLTFGGSAEKNSSASGAGTATEALSDAGGAAVGPAAAV